MLPFHYLSAAQVVEMNAPVFQGIPFPSGWDAMYPPGAQPLGEEGAYEHRAHLVSTWNTDVPYVMRRGGNQGRKSCTVAWRSLLVRDATARDLPADWPWH